MAASPASPLADLGSGSLVAYWRFHRAVAKAQLAAWLPTPVRLLVDISGPAGAGAAQAAAAGHEVVRVIPCRPGPWMPGSGSFGPGPAAGAGGATGALAPRASGERGSIQQVMAEPGTLGFLADECADAVIADDGALSYHLMTEDLAAEIGRVLRPGGELFACVDSLVLGMAMLAEQRRWAHLADLPHAEVVLIPWPDGTITRCFGAAQLRDLLTEAGLHVKWIRPRTVLSPPMVDHVLRHEPGAMARLVEAELRAGRDRVASVTPEEPFGIRLIAAARKAPLTSGHVHGGPPRAGGRAA